MTNDQIVVILHKNIASKINEINSKIDELSNLFSVCSEANKPYAYAFIKNIKADTYDGPVSTLSEVAQTFKNMLSSITKKSEEKFIIEELDKTFELKDENSFKLNSENELKKKIISTISAIRNIQSQIFSEVIGYHFGKDLNDRVNVVKNSFSDQDVELIILKRHEICSSAAKGYGFHKDADLDAVQGLGTQSFEELISASQVQTSALDWLNLLGSHSTYVDMKVSPVSRAVSTALLATIDHNKVNEMVFDSNMAEQQWPLKYICSGQASKKPSEHVNLMEKYKFYRASVGNDELFEGETTENFKNRLREAVDEVLKYSSKVASNLRMNLTVGHGDMNKAIASKIFEKFKIPGSVTKLNYGEQYIFVGVRDPKTKELSHVEYLGIYNRYGSKNLVNQTFYLFKDYLELSDDNSKNEFILKNKDKLLDNLPELVFRDRSEIDSMNFLLQNLLKAQKDELKERYDNPSSPVNKEQYQIVLRFKSLINAMSSKDPLTQKESLDSLDGLLQESESSIVNINELKKLYDNVCKEKIYNTPEDNGQANSGNAESIKDKLSPGKVTKLIKAFIDLHEFKQMVSPQNSSRASFIR